MLLRVVKYFADAIVMFVYFVATCDSSFTLVHGWIMLSVIYASASSWTYGCNYTASLTKVLLIQRSVSGESVDSILLAFIRAIQAISPARIKLTTGLVIL